LDDSNDYADGRDTKFNPLVLDEIQAADDTDTSVFGFPGPCMPLAG
jgi:hypothetical protein